MPRPPIETGRPGIAFLVAFAALGVAVWLFANAEEASLSVPTAAERLAAIAEASPQDTELLVVPTELPPNWREPGITTATGGDRLERFELRVLRRIEDPDKEGAFVQARLYVCTGRDAAPCREDRIVLAQRDVGGLTTIVAAEDTPVFDVVAADWDDVELTADWQSLDWPTRLR